MLGQVYRENQKLVEEVEDDRKSAKFSPEPPPIITLPKMKSVSSEGTTTRSHNSASCSIIEQSDPNSKIYYVNERRPRPQDDSRFDFKGRPRKLLKDCSDDPATDDATEALPSTNVNSSNASCCIVSDKFDDRPIKHHSFVSEVPDVKHMERALLGLLDDFHSGKLKAFGSGCTMDQMTKIREQQESLAKLHFELAAAEEDSLENGSDLNAAKAQENMQNLVQRLEQLSISIEQLQTSHSGL
ncbi:CCDC28A family protein [Megaselia abdita]